MEFFNIPHVPNKRSKRVIVDFRTSNNTIKKFEKLGIQVIHSYYSDKILSSVSGHPDMTIIHLGGSDFICSSDSYNYYKEKIPDANLKCGNVDLKENYPFDITYNITILDKFIYTNMNSNQTEILKMMDCTKKNILNVKQGYTKCNICIINKNAIITSDMGIYKIGIQNGIDVLLISSGNIELKGMDYGFIGGATGLIAPDKLAVNGDIKTHPDYKKITTFCKKYNVEIVSLKNGILEDIGSILPIS